MMVLPDTSVWIEFFKGHEPYRSQLLELQENEALKVIEVVFAELLQGALHQREVTLIETYYGLLPQVEVPHLILKAGKYAQSQRLVQHGMSLIDAIIIKACLEENLLLWTLDKKVLRFLNNNSVPYFGKLND